MQGGIKNLLLLGRNIKIIRLKLVDDTSALTDELGRLWLDVCFDDRALLVDKTTTSDGQFMTLKEILSTNFQVLTSNEDLAVETWYELVVGNQAKVIRPSSSRNVFDEPEFYPDWLLLDRSVRLSDDDQQRLVDYIDGSTSVKLATINSWSAKLLKQTSLALFDRPEATAATVATLVRRAQLADERLLAVIAKRHIYLADNQRTVKIKRPDKFPAAEIYNYLLKLADYQYDAEDQAKLLAWLMKQTAAGRTIDWTGLDGRLTETPAVEIISGSVNHLKSLAQLVKQLAASTKPWTDISRSRQLNSDEYSQLVDNLLITKGLDKLTEVVLIGGEVKPQVLSKLKLTTRVGVRLNTGYESMPGFETESVTAGLDGLAERMADYQQAGCQLAVWPVKYTLSETLPHDASILSNSHIATRFAKLAQENGLLPVVQLLIQGCDEEKFDRIIKSLIAEMGLFKVDYANLSVLIVAPGCQSLSSQSLLDKGVLVVRQDQKVRDGEIASQAQRFKSLYSLPDSTEEEAQEIRTKFADILRRIDKQ